MRKTTTKSTKATNTKKDTKEKANNESDYGHKATKEPGKEEEPEESSTMNSDRLTGYKLIEAASKMLSRKHKSISKDTWRKEASELYEHNERFDGEPVSLSWFITKLENLAANKYSKSSNPKDQEGESDLQSFMELKKRGLL